MADPILLGLMIGGIVIAIGWTIYYHTHPRMFVEGIDYSIPYQDARFIVYQYSDMAFRCQGLGYCGEGIWPVDPQIDSSNYDILFTRSSWIALYKCQQGEKFGGGHCVDQATRDDLRNELAKIINVPEK